MSGATGSADGARRAPARAARRGPAADRVLRRAVGRRVPRARRRGRRRAVPDRASSPAATTLYVWGILAGSAVGLLASTMGRLYASTYYALHDTRTPLRFALVRVVLTIGPRLPVRAPAAARARDRPALGSRRAHGVRRPRRLGWSSCCSRRTLNTPDRRRRALPVPLTARLWAAAAAGAAAAWVAARRDPGAASRRRGDLAARRLRRRLSPGDRPARRVRGRRRSCGGSDSGNPAPAARVRAVSDRPMTAPRIPDALQRKLDTLPDGPGVYLWKDAAGEILYVGKAKRLREPGAELLRGRLRRPARRTSLLQRLIADVETIVVAREAQSLLLENNLIKEYQPRFNVRLKDDKSYPSIAVTLGEPFPRVLVTRRRDIPGRALLRPLHRRRPAAPHPRASSAGCSPCGAATTTCPRERRERPCLDYHIGRCRAPCVGLADAGGLPRDDRGRGRLPRGPDRRRAAEGPRGDARRPAGARTTSAPRTCATRSAGWSGSRSRPASRSSAPATPT